MSARILTIVFLLTIALALVGVLIGYRLKSDRVIPDVTIYTSCGLYHVSYNDLMISEENSDTMVSFTDMKSMSLWIYMQTYRDLRVSQVMPYYGMLDNVMSDKDSLLILDMRTYDTSAVAKDTMGYIILNKDYEWHFHSLDPLKPSHCM